MKGWFTGFVVGAWVLVGGVSARAQGTPPAVPPAAAPAAPPIGQEPTVAVIELYLKGENAIATSDYSRAIAASLARTGRYAVMERDEVAQRFRSVLITPVRRLQMERLSAIERLVREGDELVYTDPKAAVEVLGRARTELESIAEGLAANERLREEFLKTLMLLARSHLDSGNEVKAGEVLREVIRVYGETLQVTEKDYHPRLVRLYQKELKKMEDERTARLRVETPVNGCTTLLDGRELPGTTPAEYRRLFPGVHHVQIRCGAKESMIRRVLLEARQPAHLVVNVDFENALTVEGGRLGLMFENAAELERLVVQYAAKFGSLINADMVVAHGFLLPGTRADLRAWLIDVRSESAARTASVPAKTDVVTPSSVQVLVQTLTTAEPAPVLVEESEGRAAGPKRWYQNYWAWTATGVGVAAIAAGGGLLASYLNHRSNATSPYKDNNGQGSPTEYDYKKSEADKALTMRTASAISFGVGAAALAGGVVLFVMTDRIWPPSAERTRQKGPRFFATPAPVPGGASLMGRLDF